MTDDRGLRIADRRLAIVRKVLVRLPGRVAAKFKRPGAFLLPARADSTKSKHRLLSCDTNPRFHGGCFGVWGHTSWKALRL